MTTLLGMESAHKIQRSWDMSRSAPVPLGPGRVVVRSISHKEPLEIDTPKHMTVRDLKMQITQRWSVSPRKALVLRWYGVELDGVHSLSHFKIPDGATLDLSLTNRSASEVEKLKAQLRQVRVQNFDGKSSIVEGIKTTTKVIEVKKIIGERKLFKPEDGYLGVDPKNPICELVHSSVFGASFGVPLENDRTLGSYGMVHDDVIFFKPVPDPELKPERQLKE